MKYNNNRQPLSTGIFGQHQPPPLSGSVEVLQASQRTDFETVEKCSIYQITKKQKTSCDNNDGRDIFSFAIKIDN